MKDSDRMNTNSAGYNAYFFANNMSALKNARMPNYSQDNMDNNLKGNDEYLNSTLQSASDL